MWPGASLPVPGSSSNDRSCWRTPSTYVRPLCRFADDRGGNSVSPASPTKTLRSASWTWNTSTCPVSPRPYETPGRCTSATLPPPPRGPIFHLARHTHLRQAQHIDNPRRRVIDPVWEFVPAGPPAGRAERRRCLEWDAKNPAPFPGGACGGAQGPATDMASNLTPRGMRGAAGRSARVRPSSLQTRVVPPARWCAGPDAAVPLLLEGPLPSLSPAEEPIP